MQENTSCNTVADNVLTRETAASHWRIRLSLVERPLPDARFRFMAHNGISIAAL